MASSSATKQRDIAILVHGLWMHGLVMLPLQWRLQRAGFVVRRFSYPSMRKGLEANVQALVALIEGMCGGRVHLVGHSLGGLVALAALARFAERPVGRAVLMGSPYVGCHCAAYLLRRPLLNRMVGRSLRDWLAQPRPRLPAAAQVGVLAGNGGWGLGRLIPGLPEPNDGVVALTETPVPAARDAICLPLGHTRMLFSSRCALQVAAFLRTGNFIHD